ncbi:MAG: nucleotidyltransferase family protein [Ruminococcaceae bacterium]|nr:nucleotidyltransferase family protein [Oscillospiraceae bacterium]
MHVAVITEYNPFHLGHEYQLLKLRTAFPDACITAIMGGIFSQRGEPYIASPYTRAAAAVKCGADLVVELPFPYSCAPAGIFARAGVEIAAKIGADMLAFGSECGDTAELFATLSRLESDEMTEAVRAEGEEIGKTRAYANAYKKLYGKDAPSLPNDILAIEYLRAIKHGGYDIKPYTVKRVGDFKSGEGGFASATSIRNAFEKCDYDALSGKVPLAAEKIYLNEPFGTDIEKVASAVLLNLLNVGDDIAFSGGGLLNHLKNASQTVKSIAELRKNAATKRYTDAEISRAIIYSLFSVKKADLEKEVQYTRLFAANSRGREVLNFVRDIEVVTKPSALHAMSDTARAQFERTFLAERAFALCLDGEYEFLKQSPRIE